MKQEKQNKERSREESLEKEKKEKEKKEADKNKEESLFTYSIENYKKQKIFTDNFDICSSPFEDKQDLSLFEKKIKAKELFEKRKKENIQIEEILEYDNTNKIIQLEYLTLIANRLLKEDDEKKILILIEKINKASIICDEIEYNKAISILPDNYRSNVKYRNYKKILINSMNMIYSFQKNDDINKVWNSFEFDKKYEFNQESQIGENNYFFYCLVYQIIISDIGGILNYLTFYKPYISRLINFLNKHDFACLKEEQQNYFEYLFNIITDGEVLRKIPKEELNNYLDSYEAYLNGENEKIMDNNSIKDISIYFTKLNESISKLYGNQNYIFKVENNRIKVDIKDEFRIGRNFKKIEKSYSYDISIFIKEMNRIIKESLTIDNFYDFEAIFQENLRYGMEHKPNEEYFAKFKEIITKILKSKSAKKYFEKYYKSKNKGLTYHFDRDNVIEEIFKRITFCSIFKFGDQAYTSPLQLKIYINCIPGKYNKLTIHPFERKILQFSRLIVITVHEILGHFFCRYYSFLTNNLIKFGIKEDNNFKTGEEGGIFVEQKLLGLTYRSISLRESLGFLKQDFEVSPIVFKNKIPKETLQNIINNNNELLDLISVNNEFGKITVEDLYYYLLEGFSQVRVNCGSRRETAIYIENINKAD